MYTDKDAAKINFQSEFTHNKLNIDTLVGKAKRYILANYKDVQDWSDITLMAEDNKKTTTTYMKIEDSKKDSINDAFPYLEKLETEAVQTLTNVVLDDVDGDFSVTINGRDHLWIDDESIISIANYINKYKFDTAITVKNI